MKLLGYILVDERRLYFVFTEAEAAAGVAGNRFPCNQIFLIDHCGDFIRYHILCIPEADTVSVPLKHSFARDPRGHWGYLYPGS